MRKLDDELMYTREPDAFIEYLFVEKELDLDNPPILNQGFFYDDFGLIFTEPLKKDAVSLFMNIFTEEFNKRQSELTYFEGKTIDLNEYKFVIIDKDKKLMVFKEINTSFFKKLLVILKFMIVGKELDLEKFKNHKIFDDFYKFVYNLFDKDKILDNYREPDATIEYLFVEKAEQQIKVINDDQAYIMAFEGIFFTGELENNNLTAFKTSLQEELNFSLQELKNSKNESVDFDDYRFYLVDNDKNTIEFSVMDETFYEALMASLRNLVIVGKNFDLESFKQHPIFLEWFDKYSNKT